MCHWNKINTFSFKLLSVYNARFGRVFFFLFCLSVLNSYKSSKNGLINRSVKQPYVLIVLVLSSPERTAKYLNFQLAVVLLAQLDSALNRYREVLQGSSPGKPEFFPAFFSQLFNFHNLVNNL